MDNLTIDEIHKIRRDHAALTKNMSFEDYKADLQKEIKPIWDLLRSMKVENKTKGYYCAEIESTIFSEPQPKY